MERKGKGFAVFLASVCVSLVVLGGLLLLFMLYMKTTRAEAVKLDEQVRTRYQPAGEESLRCLLLGCRRAESLPELVLLLSYDAPGGTLTVVGIPPEAVCTVNGRTDTLSGHYDYEGVRGAAGAVQALFGVEVDRYLRTQQTGLSNLTDFFGGVPWGEEERLLDGRQAVSLLFGQEESELLPLKERTGLSLALLERGLPAALTEAQYEAFTQAVFYNCETNLSQYDFVLRKKGLLTWGEGGLTFQSAVLQGSPDSVSGGLLPDEESAEKITVLLEGISL